MGRYQEGSITNFTPDDDENTLHIETYDSLPLTELLSRIGEKWPGVSFDEIKVKSEYIHTRCLTYDRYDPSDYDHFIVITKD